MNETHDVDVLNEGLQGEYFGILAYDAALGTGLLSDRVAPVARQFQADHRAHAQAIREAIERLGRSWRAKPMSCATRHRWSAGPQSRTRRRWPSC